ncbi:MAG: PepSY-like domain-containing protein [Saprospirales bacterium]|nr:PepSY-like domain-containing protein [Saprospirales bacterium]
MKKFAFYLIGGALAVWLAACTKEAVTDFQQLDDEALATAIAGDRGKQEIDPSTLPAEILTYAEENHFDTYIDAVYFAEGKGYDLVFATEEHAFFNLARRALRHHHNDRMGPCGRLLGGEAIPLDALRPAIVQYVETNYPDAEILRAKKKGDRIIVMLSGHVLLVFTENGVFEIDAQHWIDCRPCAPASQVDIPADVLALIETTVPGAEIKRVCRRGDRIVVGVIAADGRHILVFDNNWNFLFTTP